MAYEADTDSWHSSDDDQAAHWLQPASAAAHVRPDASAPAGLSAAQPAAAVRQPSKPLRLLVLVGLTGSGKSTLAGKLLELGRTAGMKWTRISQDKLGKRSRCERKAREELSKGINVIIDRTNLTPDQRAICIAIAHEHGAVAEAVVLTTHPDECRRRAVARTAHEGDVFGSDAARVVNAQMGQEGRSEPLAAEGFEHIHRVSSSEAAAVEVLQYMPPAASSEAKYGSEHRGPVQQHTWQSQPAASQIGGLTDSEGDGAGRRRSHHNGHGGKGRDQLGEGGGGALDNHVLEIKAPAYYLSPTKKAVSPQKVAMAVRPLAFAEPVATQDDDADWAASGAGAGGAGGTAAAAAATAARRSQHLRQRGSGSWVCSICDQSNAGGTQKCSLCFNPRSSSPASFAGMDEEAAGVAGDGMLLLAPPAPAHDDDDLLFGSWNDAAASRGPSPVRPARSAGASPIGRASDLPEDVDMGRFDAQVSSTSAREGRSAGHRSSASERVHEKGRNLRPPAAADLPLPPADQHFNRPSVSKQYPLAAAAAAAAAAASRPAVSGLANDGDSQSQSQMDAERREYLRTATQRDSPAKPAARGQSRQGAAAAAVASVDAPAGMDWLWQWDSDSVCPVCVQPWREIGGGRDKQTHIAHCRGRSSSVL